MLREDSQKLLLEISKVTEDASRQIRSPKIDLDGVKTLSGTLRILASSLTDIYETEKLRLK